MKTIAPALLTLLFSTMMTFADDCAPATSSQIEGIRAAMEDKLLDAQSARFKDVCVDPQKRKTGSNPTFCGKVNAKNKFGAYAGYRKFSYVQGAKEPTFLTMADTSHGFRERLFYCSSCLGTFDFCLKQKWITNPKLLR